jgi:hypothetical protein
VTIHDTGGAPALRRIATSNAGLCGDCVHSRMITSDRGSTFVQCQLSFSDSRFAKYPRLPVLNCSGYAKRSLSG